MIYCPDCEAANHDDAEVCSQCGTALVAIFKKRNRPRPSSLSMRSDGPTPLTVAIRLGVMAVLAAAFVLYLGRDLIFPGSRTQSSLLEQQTRRERHVSELLDLRWGTLRSRVKHRESTNPHTETAEAIGYINIIEGVPCSIAYQFTNDVLSGIAFEAPSALNTKVSVRTLVKITVDRFTEDFGKPVKEVVRGDTLAKSWQNKETRAAIMLTLTENGTNFDVTVLLMSRQLNDLPNLE